MIPEPTLTPAKCLDALESNLKTVLLHTGSALSDPSNFDSSNITQTKARIAKHLPEALDEFQLALRQLELELIRAKSALQRDLAATRGIQYASAPGTNTVSSPQPIDLDNDTVMIEAPRHHAASISHVFGPPTPDPKLEQSSASQNSESNAKITDHEAKPQEDDPFEHPKPVEFNAGQDNRVVETSTTTYDKSVDMPTGSTTDSQNNSNDVAGEAPGNNATSDTDDLSLLLGVEMYARGDNANDFAVKAQSANDDNIDSQPENGAGEQNGNKMGDQSGTQNDNNNEDLPTLSENFDFDDLSNLFGFDADGIADSNANGIGDGVSGDGDVQGWDSSLFDENFFDLDGTS